MVRFLIISLPFFGLISCSGDGSENNNAVTDSSTVAVDPLQFSDIVPATLHDSLKTGIIAGLTETIDLDTALAQKEFKDTAGQVITAFYRNDSLVKIVTASHPWMTLDQLLSNSEGGSYTTYYFCADTLISVWYRCSSTRQTGRCNPVRASNRFYLYAGTIIGSEHDVKIGQYGMCGCTDLSYYERENRTAELEAIFKADEVRLRKIIDDPDAAEAH